MPANTINYYLPYPLQTDSVDVAVDIKNLAEETDSVLSTKASVDTPIFIGSPQAPTASVDTDTDQIATTAFVINQDYLKTSVAESDYATLNSPSFTGSPLAPTASVGTNTNQMATTAFVTTAIGNIDALPSQAENAGKFLKTDASTAYWDQITTSDVSGLQVVISGLSSTYAPLNVEFVLKTESYELSSLTEASKQIELNSASSNILTIPTDSNVNYPIGTTILVLQTGVGQTTIAGASGVTVNATPGLKLRAQWSLATLIKRGVNLWLVSGDVVA